MEALQIKWDLFRSRSRTLHLLNKSLWSSPRDNWRSRTSLKAALRPSLKLSRRVRQMCCLRHLSSKKDKLKWKKPPSRTSPSALRRHKNELRPMWKWVANALCLPKRQRTVLHLPREGRLISSQRQTFRSQMSWTSLWNPIMLTRPPTKWSAWSDQLLTRMPSLSWTSENRSQTRSRARLLSWLLSRMKAWVSVTMSSLIKRRTLLSCPLRTRRTAIHILTTFITMLQFSSRQRGSTFPGKRWLSSCLATRHPPMVSDKTKVQVPLKVKITVSLISRSSHYNLSTSWEWGRACAQANCHPTKSARSIWSQSKERPSPLSTTPTRIITKSSGGCTFRMKT